MTRLPQILTDRRVATMLGLGFSSGIPFLLVYGTQSIWLTEAKVPIHTIGLLSEMTLAYKFKFVWAPFLDRYDPPLIGRVLGRRRGWIIIAQVLVVLALIGVAFGDPGHWLAWTIGFSLALGFAGATHDVVVDGWRINAAPDKKAVMASWAEIGWRIGTFAASAGVLYLTVWVGWRGAYLLMAVAMVPGMVSALLAPEPEVDRGRPPHSLLGFVLGAFGALVRWIAFPIGVNLVFLADVFGLRADTLRAAVARTATREGDREPGLLATVWAPIKELVTRLGPMAAPILLLVAGFRMPGYVASAMANPLFKSLHYSNADIATVTKLFGFGVALAATLLGGWLVPRIGMMASLLVGTVAGSASHLALAWLAAHGDHGGGEFWTFAIAVSIDSFAYAFASIVLITYMSTLCASEMAASQYALLTSLVALPGSVLAGGSGFLIERLGFERFFEATSLIGLPVALLCVWVWYRHALTQPAPTSVSPSAPRRSAASRRA